jgi:hypothetical protein
VSVAQDQISHARGWEQGVPLFELHPLGQVAPARQLRVHKQIAFSVRYASPAFTSAISTSVSKVGEAVDPLPGGKQVVVFRASVLCIVQAVELAPQNPEEIAHVPLPALDSLVYREHTKSRMTSSIYLIHPAVPDHIK